MSELTDYEWAQRALNCLYLELHAQVASDCIPKLKRIIELYESDITRLREAIASVRHKGHCATVKHSCKGIEIEKGVFSGCAGGDDCPICNGVKPTCTCGIDGWKDTVLNNKRDALKEPPCHE